MATKADQVAILWEGDETKDVRRITFGELFADVCKVRCHLAPSVFVLLWSQGLPPHLPAT